MTPVNVCTVITRNRLPTRASSQNRSSTHHPDGTITALVLDDPEESIEREAFLVLRPGALAISDREFLRMAASYGPLQLACAMKPLILKYLLGTFGDAAVYLDSDIQVFDSLEEVVELAKARSIVLTPHLTEPPPRPPGWFEEVGKLVSGSYNAGFLALGPGSTPFLDWWSARLARECIQAPERGLYDDQRWLDLVPSYFEHALLRDPGYNVAFWNLLTRDVTRTGEHYEVNGSPLRFFHFGGFDPHAPHVISRWQRPAPVVLLSERPAVAAICREYAQRLFAAGYRESIQLPYGLDELVGETRLTPPMREAYRTELEASEREGEPEPPNPFSDGSEAFLTWLNEPLQYLDSAHALSRYLLSLWNGDVELRRRFPSLHGDDALRYYRWAVDEGQVGGIVPEGLAPRPRLRDERSRVAGTPSSLQFGVNLVFEENTDRPLDELRRAVARWLADAGIPHTEIGWRSSNDHEAGSTDARQEAAPFDINLVCLNPLELVGFAFEVDAEFFARRHSVGIWLDEELPAPNLDHALAFLDEIWVASSSAASALSARTSKEVRVIPVPIEPPEPLAGPRQHGAGNGIAFLSIADFGGPFAPGKLESENPLAVIEAFRRAFPTNENAELLLRCIRGKERLVDLEQLRLAAARPRISIIEGPLSPSERRELVAACDCYVSLHRCTEFSIPAAEAMAYGKPVVATGFSGNLQYMDMLNSYLVDGVSTPPSRDCNTFWSGQEWIEPGLDQAAALLRHIFLNRDDARRIGARASAALRGSCSGASLDTFLATRIGELWNEGQTLRSQVHDPADPISPAMGLERAEAYLSTGPTNSWAAPSRFGGLGKLGRHTILRLVRPYSARHAELDASVVLTLRELSRRQEETETRLAELSHRDRDDR